MFQLFGTVNFFMTEEGLVGFGKHHFNRMIPPRLTDFSLCPPPYSGHFLKINILYFSPTSRYCFHYEDNIYNPYTTESC